MVRVLPTNIPPFRRLPTMQKKLCRLPFLNEAAASSTLFNSFSYPVRPRIQKTSPGSFNNMSKPKLLSATTDPEKIGRKRKRKKSPKKTTPEPQRTNESRSANCAAG